MDIVDENTRYLRSGFLQKILSFLVSISFSFCKFIKIIPHGLFCPEKSFKFTLVYPSLQNESISSSCMSDSNQDLSFEVPDIKDYFSEPHNAAPEGISLPPNLVLSNTRSQYIPICFPQALHVFPTKHYKYLPKFDGEYEYLTAEGHLQSFKYFLDLFDIEHDDVRMRVFSQSLQGNVKKWFKQLQPRSSST